MGRDGAPRRPRREVAAQRGASFVRRVWFVPPALTRAGTSQRDVPTRVGALRRGRDGALRRPRRVQRRNVGRHSHVARGSFRPR